VNEPDILLKKSLAAAVARARPTQGLTSNPTRERRIHRGGTIFTLTLLSYRTDRFLMGTLLTQHHDHNSPAAATNDSNPAAKTHQQSSTVPQQPNYHLAAAPQALIESR
jgi:hypothetical protein